MFDSGITASSLITQLQAENDISLPISNATYVQWLNALEQMLYSEIIKEQKSISLTTTLASPLVITRITPATGERQACFEDIFSINVFNSTSEAELFHSTASMALLYTDVYYKSGVDIAYKTSLSSITSISINYYVRPVLKTVDVDNVIQSGNIMMPYEFLDLVTARLRGEAYKLANEDFIATKWLNDFNVLLSTFKNWIELRRARF